MYYIVLAIHFIMVILFINQSSIHVLIYKFGSTVHNNIVNDFLLYFFLAGVSFVRVLVRIDSTSASTSVLFLTIVVVVPLEVFVAVVVYLILVVTDGQMLLHLDRIQV